MGYVLSIKKKGYITPDVEFKFKDSELGVMCEMAKTIVRRMGDGLAIQIEMEEIKCCDEVKDE